MFQQKGGVKFLLLLGRSCTESPVQDECGHLLQFHLAGNAELCVSSCMDCGWPLKCFVLIAICRSRHLCSTCSLPSGLPRKLMIVPVSCSKDNTYNPRQLPTTSDLCHAVMASEMCLVMRQQRLRSCLVMRQYSLQTYV